MSISRPTDQLWSVEDVWSSSHGLTWTQEFMQQFALKSGVGRHLKPGTFRGLFVLSVSGGCWEVVVKISVRLGNFISPISLACFYSSPSHFIHSGAGVSYHLLSPEGAQPSLQPSLCLCAHPPLHTWPEWAFWQTDLVTLPPSTELKGSLCSGSPYMTSLASHLTIASLVAILTFFQFAKHANSFSSSPVTHPSLFLFVYFNWNLSQASPETSHSQRSLPWRLPLKSEVDTLCVRPLSTLLLPHHNVMLVAQLCDSLQSHGV